jgi:hypothetical protein
VSLCCDIWGAVTLRATSWSRCDAAVLFAGDLIREGGPLWIEDGYPLDWPTTLRAVEAVAAAAVVPGHGILVDRAFVYRLPTSIDRDEAAAASAVVPSMSST